MLSNSFKKSKWPVLLVEAFLIIFSVFLALLANEWRENQSEKELVNSVLANIENEIQNNKKMLEIRLPYHEAMNDSTNKFMQNHVAQTKAGLKFQKIPRLPDLGIDTNKGMQTAGNFADTGWQVALNTGAFKNMNHDVRFLLSRVYNKQEELTEAENSLTLDRLYRAYFGDGNISGAVVGFASSLTDLVLRERELLQKYEEALKKLEDPQ